ncbi:MAG: FHA domain-containing protein, partial [Chloroflexota bacterium]
MTSMIRFQFQLSGPQGEHTLVAEEGITTIGRQKGSDWHLAAPQVSRQHARLDTTTNACQITDLDSANGTFVNGEKLAPGE